MSSPMTTLQRLLHLTTLHEETMRQEQSILDALAAATRPCSSEGQFEARDATFLALQNALLDTIHPVPASDLPPGRRAYLQALATLNADYLKLHHAAIKEESYLSARGRS